MFFNSADRKRIEQLETELRELKQQNEQLQATLDATQNERKRIADEVLILHDSRQTAEALHRNLGIYGETLLETQKTLAGLANGLKGDSLSSLTSHSMTHAGRDTIQSLVSQLSSLASRTRLAMSSMKGLSNSAIKIGTIVSMIKDVADQTNLLALNAAIESGARRRKRQGLCCRGRRGEKACRAYGRGDPRDLGAGGDHCFRHDQYLP
jgi:methyl-accepting chemotaxis protein